MKNMVLWMAAGLAAVVSAYEQTVEVPSVGAVKLSCAKPAGWSFACETAKVADGVDVVTVRLSRGDEAPPPSFDVSWSVPQTDVHHFWSSDADHYGIPWNQPHLSELSNWMPLYAFLDANEENRFTFACTETRRVMDFRAPISEYAMTHNCRYTFFVRPDAPLKDYVASIRFDARRIFYGDALRDAAAWMSDAPENAPALAAPDTAFDPLYSSWYAFHQKVTAADVERECALAAPLGMKTVIVDDGWQIENCSYWNGYRYCGDWIPAKRFTDDMAAHVKRVQDLGFKYVLWYSVPFVGEKSLNFARFKGKFLPEENNCAGGWVLDPRFPEVREFIIGTYEKAVKDWNLDGFKLDFIGRFTLKGEDPAVKENYAGRDIKSVPVAVDRLLTDVTARLKALKPDILIEFRQGYVGPCIRKYGNMLRATDCPCSMAENRTRIARLRLTSGATAVHSDMLEWRPDETPESAARCVLSAMFGVIQYSVVLKTLPPDHLRMIRNWLDFSVAHRDALLRGAFRAHYPASEYPLLEGESAAERIFGVYQKDLVVKPGKPDRPVWLLNASGDASLVVDLPAAATVERFDCFGQPAGTDSVPAGLQRLAVPAGGRAHVMFR